MWDLNEVERIEYRHDYVYHITFDDGLSGESTLSPTWAEGRYSSR